MKRFEFSPPKQLVSGAMRSVANFRRWAPALSHGPGRAVASGVDTSKKERSGVLPQGLSAQELPCPRRRRPFSVLDGGVGRLHLTKCFDYGVRSILGAWVTQFFSDSGLPFWGAWPKHGFGI